MGSLSIWHWIVIALVVMLLFGKGKVSDLMGDVAKGIKSFKKGMAEDEVPTSAAGQPIKSIDTQSGLPVGDTQHTKAG